ncbi:MAG TPA: MgtC/SapB family protein [Verrucomicrobiae bacterium]|jgi:putative Mg2+ transporter-C (MgtC) family protein
MPVRIGWDDILLRLFLTVVAGALIGANREEAGRPAGLRTILLVGLAAALSMIQANLLLAVHGKAPDSFVVMDLMRLPLGILSGMGFIGAGAILRKDNMVVGVTTAATMWFMTVLGLCFGGGQLGLGIVALAVGLGVLWALKPIEHLLKQTQQAKLTLVVGNQGPNEQDILRCAAAAGGKVSSVSVVYETGGSLREIHCMVQWRARPGDVLPPAFVNELAKREDTFKVMWLK